MIHDLGAIKITDTDAGNIPVDIWIARRNGDSGYWEGILDIAKNTQFVLAADNYMPRKGRLSGEQSYLVYADTRDELVDLIRAHIMPLYQAALATLKSVCDGDMNDLYYWDAPRANHD
jgi:hypothetical protein